MITIGNCASPLQQWWPSFYGEYRLGNNVYLSSSLFLSLKSRLTAKRREIFRNRVDPAWEEVEEGIHLSVYCFNWKSIRVIFNFLEIFANLYVRNAKCDVWISRFLNFVIDKGRKIGEHNFYYYMFIIF